MTEREIKFANGIYQNASMGMESITYLYDRIKDDAMRAEMQTQHCQYNNIAVKATELLNRGHEFPKDKGPMSEIGLWAGVQMNLMKDSSSSHIAEMIMQGSTMGIINIIRLQKEYPDASEELKILSNQLIQIEENNFQRMKAYLQ